MNTYRFTLKTKCGKTDVAAFNAGTLEEAEGMLKRHLIQKHSPMKLLRIDVKCGMYGTWSIVKTFPE